MVGLARPHDHGPDDPGGARAPGGVLSGPGDEAAAPPPPTDPDDLLRALRSRAGHPPLPPLTLGAPARSTRGGPAGPLVSRARAAVLQLIAPALGELLGQLERDRHRTRAEVARLEERIAELERRAAD